MRKLSHFSWASIAVLFLAGSGITGAAERENGKGKTLDREGIERLKHNAGGKVRVSTSPATGGVRFAAIAPGAQGDLLTTGPTGAREKSRQFLREYASIFGLADADTELQLADEKADALGQRHLSYLQTYRGVPVFGGILRTHVGSSGELLAINGNIVPNLRLSVIPTQPAERAGATAIAAVSAANQGRAVSVRSGLLMIYREGLARGVEGPNHLAWQIEVGNDGDLREFVYVDAHTGKLIERLPGVYDSMFRRAFDGQFNANVPPPNWPTVPFWVEGQPFPTGNGEADNMITSSKETYDFYRNAFGRDSFDGAGAIMDAIFNRGNACPNASWNGTFISFCNGLTTDDITGHEWTHAYSQYTHGLIYLWQPGALNESYSDIFGETIDRINGRGGDSPDLTRVPDACSVVGGTPPPAVTVTGGSAAGTYPALASVNEPTLPVNVGPADMAIAVPNHACTPVTGVTGKIAIIDFTLNPDGTSQCGSGARAANAINGGAVGIIFVAPPAGLLLLGSNPAIASLEVTNADGEAIKHGLPANGTITIDVGTDPSVRWLLGEDDTAIGAAGPGRDMWNPRCFGNPGKVSDTFEYVCDINTDLGGVHINSGIPNHAYALLVDGGTYNGQTITGIGLTKAAHIYFRAMSVYQHPSTDFADHADAIEQSAEDLIGTNLPDLVTGFPSGQVITAADVDQVEKVMLAVEMRNPPPCTFQPLLAQDPPALCPASQKVQELFGDDFEKKKAKWDASHEAVVPAEFTDRDWKIVSDVPDRAGHAVFAPTPLNGTCIAGSPLDGNEAGVLHLTSPEINIPASASNARLTFVHWVSTEAAVDGGNISISVNGGPWQLLQPGDFIYNAYTANLITAAGGNTNPMAGQPAFTGSDGGSVLGSWGRSIVDLSAYAHAKDRIRLRYDFGTDCGTGLIGWYVDDVSVYRCK